MNNIKRVGPLILQKGVGTNKRCFKFNDLLIESIRKSWYSVSIQDGKWLREKYKELFC